jgi:hypothetical protein
MEGKSMKEYFALATVSYYNQIANETETEKIVLTEVGDFTDAMSRVEKYYSNDLEGVFIELFEGPFVGIVTDGAYYKIKETGNI